MTIRTIFIFGLIFLLLSCEQLTDKNKILSTKPATGKDTVEDISKIGTTIKQTTEPVASYQQELDIVLADPYVDDYYKEIYRQEKMILTSDNKMLSITDSLSTKDNDKDLFYFIVFTKSMNGPDGFYSEAIGLSTYKFLMTQTYQFADYFNNAPKLTDKDMNNWADYVYGEIQISRENEEQEAIRELENSLLDNLKGAGKEHKFVIGRFMQKIKCKIP